MSMEERTLVVRNIDGERLSVELLEELFSNFGPLVRVVLRPTFAFIEYTKKESVGYAWAMTEGIYLQGRRPRIAPKLLDDPAYYSYKDRLQEFEHDIHFKTKSFDVILTKEQIKEKKEFIDALNSRSNAIPASSARRRYRKYLQHFEPYDTFNPLIGKDLSIDDREREHDHHRHASKERHSANQGRNNRDQRRSHSDRNNNSHQYQGHAKPEEHRQDTSRNSSKQNNHSNRDRKDRPREYERHDRRRSERGGNGGHQNETPHKRDRSHR